MRPNTGLKHACPNVESTVTGRVDFELPHITICELQLELYYFAIGKSLKQLNRFICVQGECVDLRYHVRFATIPAKTRLYNPLGSRFGKIFRINIQVETNDPEALTVQLCVCRKPHKCSVKRGPRQEASSTWVISTWVIPERNVVLPSQFTIRIIDVRLPETPTWTRVARARCRHPDQCNKWDQLFQICHPISADLERLQWVSSGRSSQCYPNGCFRV